MGSLPEGLGWMMSNRAADDYEDRYMSGEGRVLYRDKVRCPWYFHALIVGAGAAGIVGGLLAREAAVVAATTAITAGVWTNFAALRVTVSEKMLHVQYGLFGPQIAIDDIVSVKAGKYAWWKYGGKGIRFGLDGSVAYNMLGDRSQGVEVTYRTKRGRTRTILVSATDPDALAAAILEAKRLSTGAAAAAESALGAARADAGLLEAPTEGPLVAAPGTADSEREGEEASVPAMQGIEKTGTH